MVKVNKWVFYLHHDFPSQNLLLQKQRQLPNTSNKALKNGMGQNRLEMIQSTMHWHYYDGLSFCKKGHHCMQSYSKQGIQLGD
jgi:hypothetical protein